DSSRKSFWQHPMNFFRALVLSCVAAALLPVSRAGHPFLCTDSVAGKVAIVSAEGKVEWEVSYKHPQDCWRLPNGNFLFCHMNGAIEMTRDKKIVWEYKAPEKVEVHACQPLPDGNVMIVECGTCRIIEVGRDGKIVKEVKLTPAPEIKLH